MGPRVWANLQAAPGTLGAALLDQAVVAGIGNVFRAEALFACGMHPSRPAASLPGPSSTGCGRPCAMMGRAVDDGRIVTVDPPGGRGPTSTRTRLGTSISRRAVAAAARRWCPGSWAGAPPMAFLAHGDHAALDAAIDACPARTERTLHTRWRAISFLVRVRYEDQPTPQQPASSTAGGFNGGKGR